MNFTNIRLLNCPSKSLQLFLKVFFIFLFFCSLSVIAKPKIKIKYGYTLDGFARIQVKNETTTELACWVAIDGFKRKFRLPALTNSLWIETNDKRYTYADLKTWCDYIEFHPSYKKYDRG